MPPASNKCSGSNGGKGFFHCPRNLFGKTSADNIKRNISFRIKILTTLGYGFLPHWNPVNSAIQPEHSIPAFEVIPPHEPGRPANLYQFFPGGHGEPLADRNPFDAGPGVRRYVE